MSITQPAAPAPVTAASAAATANPSGAYLAALSNPDADRLGWLDALEGFAAHLAAGGLSEATAAGYVQHVGWLAEAAPVGPWDLSSAHLAAWLADRNWSRDTRRKVLVSLRKFYAWAIGHGLIEWAPTAGLPSPAPNRRGPARRALPPVWREPVEQYLAWLGGRAASNGTVSVRRYWLGRLSEVLADPWAVSTQQLAVWLSNPDWKPETKRAARGAVRSFYRWAVVAGHLERSPAYRLETVLIPRSLPRPAPDEAVQAALASADDRTRLAVLLAALAGLRRAEIANLHTVHVLADTLLVIGKGGHHRMVPLHPLLRRELDVELARRRRGTHGTGWSGRFVTEDGWLFPSDKTNRPMTPAHLGKLVRQVLPDGWTTHTLRHRFATQAYASERDVLAVQQLLGHTRPETTARYAQVPDTALSRAVGAVRV